MLFTIFTPTFNRMHLLERAYQSIRRQDHTGFEWLIVDDGSTDDTEALVRQWQASDDVGFSIRYIRKENGGKHTAVNLGVREAQGEFFILLDSDDRFCPGALSLLASALTTIREEQTCGVAGLTCYEDGTLIGTPFPADIQRSDMATLYYRYGVRGDKSVAFKTAVLREYPFPEPSGIRFVSELVVWHPMTARYGVACLHEYIEIKEYQARGLSDSSYRLWFWESIAFTNYYLICNDIHPLRQYPRVRFNEYVQLIINSRLSGISYYNRMTGWLDKLLYLLAYPRAWYSYYNMKRYVKNNNAKKHVEKNIWETA